MNPHEHHQTNRAAPGGATSTACPDCAVRPKAGVSALPRIEHARTCPTYLAGLRLLADDMAWLIERPAEPVRERHVRACESVDLGAALGRLVPPAQRREWRVRVTRDASGVVRSYRRGTRAVTCALALPHLAGAR